MLAKLTSKNQLAVPKQARDTLGASPAVIARMRCSSRWPSRPGRIALVSGDGDLAVLRAAPPVPILSATELRERCE
jgi:hypothetical protein